MNLTDRLMSKISAGCLPVPTADSLELVRGRGDFLNELKRPEVNFLPHDFLT